MLLGSAGDSNNNCSFRLSNEQHSKCRPSVYIPWEWISEFSGSVGLHIGKFKLFREKGASVNPEREVHTHVTFTETSPLIRTIANEFLSVIMVSNFQRRAFGLQLQSKVAKTRAKLD